MHALGLHLPLVRQGGAQCTPLVIPKVVDQYEQCCAPPIQQRLYGLGHHLWRQKGVFLIAATVNVLHPIPVIGFDVLGKLTSGIHTLHVQHLRHALVTRGGQLQVPMHQSLVDVLPIFTAQPVHQPHAQFTELPLVVAHGFFSHQPFLIQNLFERKQNLVGVQWLDQVIGHFGADGLLHNVLLLTLGDHHARQVGTALLDPLQGFQSGETGHVFIQKDHIHNPLVLKGFEEGSTICESCDFISLGLQEEDVGL